MKTFTCSFSQYSNNQIVFLLGTIFYLFLQVGVVVYTDLAREAPCEVDDAYAYILRAAKSQNGPQQTPIALESITEQAEGIKNNNELRGVRSRILWMTQSVYNPLYSYLLSSINNFVHDWEKSFRILRYTGALIIGIGIALWLKYLFGSTVAGISLFLSAFAIYAGHGLHYVVPANITLGIFLLSWVILDSDKKYYRYSIFLTIPILCYMHRIGFVYSALLIFCLFLYQPNSSLKKVLLIGSFAGLILLLCNFLGSFFFSSNFLPALNINPKKLDIIGGFVLNLQEIPRIIGTSSLFHNRWYFIFFLCSVGMFYGVGYRNTRVIKAVIVISLGLTLSLFHNFPPDPGALFGRLWMLGALLISGIVAYSMFISVILIKNCISQKKIASITFFIASATLLVGSVTTINTMRDGIININDISNYMVTRQNFELINGQVEKLLSRISNEDTVIYTDEIPLFFYLSNGLLNYKALYLPFFDQNHEKKHNNSNDDFNYISMRNPLSLLKGYFVHNSISMSKGIAIYFTRSSSEETKKHSFYVANTTNKSMIISFYDENNNHVSYSISPQFSQNIELPSAMIHSQRLELLSDENGATIHNFQISDLQTTNWPWNSGWSIQIANEHIELDTNNRYGGDKLKTVVIDDNGYTLLAGVR